MENKAGQKQAEIAADTSRYQQIATDSNRYKILQIAANSGQQQIAAQRSRQHMSADFGRYQQIATTKSAAKGK